jgi:hypothetical protein
MARKGAPGIVTVGNRHEWPREFWGSRDWQDEERLQDQLQQGKELGSLVIPPPSPPVASGFTLFPKPRKREAVSARSRAVDRLIEKHVGR